MTKSNKSKKPTRKVVRKRAYLCDYWLEYTQQLLNLVSHGHYFYYQITLPDKKKEKWESIDRKLMVMYPIEASKDKRYRRKKAGKADVVYLRWDCNAVFMHTPGNITPASGHVFTDIRETPLEVRLNADNGITVLKVGRNHNKGFTVYLAKESYREIKAEILDCIKNHRLEESKLRFRNINSLPRCNGIIRQQQTLVGEIKHQCKLLRVQYKHDDFKIIPKRKPVKVFKK